MVNGSLSTKTVDEQLLRLRHEVDSLSESLATAQERLADEQKQRALENFERKRAESALAMAKRHLQVLIESNHCLIHATDEKQLLATLCSIAVDVGGYRMAWAGFTEQDANKSIRPVASAGCEDGYLNEVKISWAENAYGCGPIGGAIRSGRPCSIQNVLQDPRFSPWRDSACKRGYAAVCGLPLIVGDQVAGVLGIYSSSPDAFDEEEVKLLNRMAQDIGFGILTLRTRIDRSRAGQALLDNEERFHLLVQNSNDVIMVLDDKGVRTSMNGPIERFFGYNPKELIGASIFDNIHSNDVQTAIKIFKETVALPGDGRRFECRCRHKNGSWIPVEAVSTNLLHDPIVRGIVINIRDMSERNKLQEQLQQTSKMEAIGRLAGGVAHDFNNLLTAINGNIELALMDIPASDPLVEYLNDAAKAGQSATVLTRQLLTFSRKQVIEAKVLNLNELLGNVKKMLVRLVGEDVVFQSKLEKKLAMVKIDPGQFEQVLVNLAVNARDAMPKGGKLILETSNADLDESYCCQHPQLAPGRYILLCVSDTGHGMSEEVQKHLFEPFFTTKSKGRGTGLGLATVFGIVKQAKGVVEVYSELDHGTTFKIFLPEAVGKEEGRIETAVVKPANGSETVLLVEDAEDVRDLTLKLLNRLGYKVLHVSNGYDALELVENSPTQIDLLMTDVVMPKMSGKDLAERMLERNSNLKVLFTSGYTEEVVIQHGIIHKNLNFIAKPFSLQTLAVKLREILGAPAINL